jgi:hypothetical protein
MQTSYTKNAALGRVGGLADEKPPRDVVTGVAAAAIPFGLFLVRDTGGDDKVKVPTAAVDFTARGSLMGVALATQAIESQTGVAAANYPIGHAINVGKKVRVIVRPEDAVTPTSGVFVRHTSGGGGTVLGSFRTDADTATAADISAYARWMSSADAGELAVLEVDL